MKYHIFTKQKLFFLSIMLLLLCSFETYSQQVNDREQIPPSPFWQNVRFGGSAGLSFGNGLFLGSLAPSAIYDFNRIFSAGAGLSAAYTSRGNFNATSLGGSLIGIARPIRQLQLSAEYEQLHINRRSALEGATLRDKYWVPALFLGLGYNTGPVTAGIRYDVLHDSQRSFYRDALMPFVRVYF